MIFGPKRTSFDQKEAKTDTKILSDLSLGYLKNRAFIFFKYAKQGRSYVQIWRTLSKCKFLVKMAKIWPKMAKSGFFGQNPKITLPSGYEAGNLWGKSENSYERILISRLDIRTDERKRNHMSQPSVTGEQKSEKIKRFRRTDARTHGSEFMGSFGL